MVEQSIRASYENYFSRFIFRLLHAARQGSDGLFIATSYYLANPGLRPALYSAIIEELSKLDLRDSPNSNRKESLLAAVKSEGLDNYPVARSRCLRGEYHLEAYVNAFRAARPLGVSGPVGSTVFKAWEPADGNWEDVPEYEVFATETIDSVTIRYLFDPYTLLSFGHLITFGVPKEPEGVSELQEPEPQYLKRWMHEMYHHIADTTPIPGFTIAVNCYGAGASKNVQHGKIIVLGEGKTWPCLDRRYRHMEAGGDLTFPTPVMIMDNCGRAYDVIDKHLQANIPISVAYLQGKCILFPARFQGTYRRLAYDVSGKNYPYTGEIAIVERLGVCVCDSMSYPRIQDRIFADQLRLSSHPFIAAK